MKLGKAFICFSDDSVEITRGGTCTFVPHLFRVGGEEGLLLLLLLLLQCNIS